MTKLPYKAVIQNILQCNANSILLANKQTQNRIESLEINPCMYINWSLTTIHDEERVALFNKWSWKTKFKRMKLKPHLILHTKVNSKWIKDWIVRPETTKLLEENIGSKLLGSNLDRAFVDLMPKSKNKQVGLQAKKLCTYLQSKLVSSVLSCRIPWTEELGGLQTTGWQSVNMTEWLTHFQGADPSVWRPQRQVLKLKVCFVCRIFEESSVCVADACG